MGADFRRLKQKRRWVIALGVAASIYAIYVTIAVERSITELHRLNAFFATVTWREMRPARKAGNGAAASGWQRSAPPSFSDAGTLARAGRGAIAPDRGIPESAVADPPDEDSSVLRQRALLEVAARPAFAELLDSRDPEVRKALLDFFGEE